MKDKEQMMEELAVKAILSLQAFDDEEATKLKGEFMDIKLSDNTIKIGDMVVPKPIDEALNVGDEYYLVNPYNIEVCRMRWDDYAKDHLWLRRRLIHEDRESATLHLHALIKVSGGVV